MKHKIFILVALFAMVGCKSNPNKAEPIETKLDKSSTISGGQKVGLSDGEMVVQEKVQIAEKLRDLQNAVYSLEDQVYGTRKFGSLGLYGDLKSCRRKLASKAFGGDGTLVWTEPLDRISDKEEEFKIGLDEEKDLVGVTREYLRDRLQRFQSYKMILQKRSDEFQEKIESCKSDIANRTMDAGQSTKVMVSEAPKASVDRAKINEFMCQFVRPGASLESLMVNAFAHGWLSLNDFKMDQTLLSAEVKDAKDHAMANGFLFNGWKMAFDNGSVTLNQLLNEGGDAKLVVWAYDKKADVSGSANCLKASDGDWNH